MDWLNHWHPSYMFNVSLYNYAQVLQMYCKPIYFYLKFRVYSRSDYLFLRMRMLGLGYCVVKRKTAIRNRYNQVPHLTRDTRDTVLGKWRKLRKTQHTRGPRGQPCPSRWSQDCKEQTIQHNKGRHETAITKSQKMHKFFTSITWFEFALQCNTLFPPRDDAFSKKLRTFRCILLKTLSGFWINISKFQFFFN